MPFMITNGWALLNNELDGPMLEHATNPQVWHNSFVTHLMDNYFTDRPHRVAVDIGASYGWMSLGFAQHFGAVHAFELREDVRSALQFNMRNLPSVTVHPYGLGAQSAEITFRKTDSTGTTSLLHPVDGPTMAASIRPLDEFGLTNVDLIKIDVEGYELPVLQGAISTIARCKPVLVVEILHTRKNSEFTKRQKIFALLREHGYYIADVRQADYVFVAS